MLHWSNLFIVVSLNSSSDPHMVVQTGMVCHPQCQNGGICDTSSGTCQCPAGYNDGDCSGKMVCQCFLEYAITGKKLEVNLTQNGLPQLQDLYHLPLLPQCRVTAFVYSKFQMA